MSRRMVCEHGIYWLWEGPGLYRPVYDATSGECTMHKVARSSQFAVSKITQPVDWKETALAKRALSLQPRAAAEYLKHILCLRNKGHAYAILSRAAKEVVR